MPANRLEKCGAVLGGLVFGLALCFAIPLAALIEMWRGFRRPSPSPSLPPPPPAATKPPREDGDPTAASFVIDVCAADGSDTDPDDPPQQPFVTTDLSILLPLFRAHGTGSLSYAALVNKEYAHLYCPQLGGAIAFVAAPPHKRFGNVRAVMAVGDPLAPRESWPAIGQAFLAHFASNSFFAYASAEFARVLIAAAEESDTIRPRLLHANDWGLATRILLPPSTPSPPPGCRSAQQDARRALKSGLRVREVALLDLLSRRPPTGKGDNDNDDNTRQQLRAISAQWLSTKLTRDRELRVFCRHLNFDENALLRDAEAGTRLFVAERGDGDGDASTAIIDTFVLLDPQFENGAVVGWVLASSRARPGAHKGALKLLVQHLVTSGVLRRLPLDLGLAPFAGIAAPANCPFGGGAAWMRLAARFLFSCADGRLYAFRNLAQQKAHYAKGRGGEQAPLFCVHGSGGGGFGGVFGAWLPSPTFVVELYSMMVYVGFVGDGVLDTVLRLWGVRGSR